MSSLLNPASLGIFFFRQPREYHEYEQLYYEATVFTMATNEWRDGLQV